MARDVVVSEWLVEWADPVTDERGSEAIPAGELEERLVELIAVEDVANLRLVGYGLG